MNTKQTAPLRFLESFGYVGQVLWDCIRMYQYILMGRQRLDLKAFLQELHHLGLSPLPVVTLLAAAIGLIIGIHVDRVLDQVSLFGVLIGTIGLSVVREFTPLLIGIFVAARSGVALAVEIGTMRLNGEADGLILCGVNPVHFTVGPALLAMLIMSFALTVWSGTLILGLTAIFLWWESGIPLTVFQTSLNSVLTTGDIIMGITKPLIFALLVALISALNGRQVDRTNHSVSSAATRTMIGAVVAIVLVDLTFAYFSYGLRWTML